MQCVRANWANTHGGSVKSPKLSRNSTNGLDFQRRGSVMEGVRGRYRPFTKPLCIACGLSSVQGQI